MVTDAGCLFCQMSKGAFPVDMIHQDGLVFAINDINPRAPVHFMVIPRQHIPSVHDLTNDHAALLGHMVYVANKLAADLEIAERGFRLVFNAGADGGQSVYHLHMHVLGGAQLGPEA